MKPSERFWPSMWFTWFTTQVWTWSGVALLALGGKENELAQYVGLGMIISSIGTVLALTALIFVIVRPEDDENG